MASAEQLECMRQWLKDHGGFINPNVEIAHSMQLGVHVRASTDVGADSRLCTVPHSLALSSLNAYVDDVFPAFKQSRGSLDPQATGYFYLMHQYIVRSRSFWRPYLDTLPQPGEEYCTPFWFDDQDSQWLKDTDVFFSTTARQETHHSQYRDGVAILRKAGVDPSPYTWDLFKWAVTMFTSRSFSSQAIRPRESKYWTAYRTGPDGRRQTILLDLSTSSAADLDFPVLFPVADAANHRHDAKAEWTFDPGRFTIAVKDSATQGTEVCNNYGPKGNAELLLGYGFCIVDNPNDSVLLTLKAPPADLQSKLQGVHPGYFSSDATWDSARATFALHEMAFDDQNPSKVFESVPEPLLELMFYILRHERGLAFCFVEHPFEVLLSGSGQGRRYLPHIARMIVQSLAPKLAKLQSGRPEGAPRNRRQEQAKIYRDGQMKILESVIMALRSFTRSLLPAYPPNSEIGPVLVTSELLLELAAVKQSDADVKAFLTGIAASAGTTDIDQLRQAGWEDDVLVLLLCYLYIASRRPGGNGSWFMNALPEYLTSISFKNAESEAEEGVNEQAGGLLQIVNSARQESAPDSIWRSALWTSQLIAIFGGGFVQHDSFLMMVPVHASGNGTGEAVRPVVYLHR